MKKNKAYSKFEFKSFSEEGDLRIVEGIATTPRSDRTGDIVFSDGVVYKMPIPFLWQHNHEKPIGTLLEVEVTAEGIKFKAQILKIDEEGTLKDRVDEAWQSIKSGIVAYVSIGFVGLEWEINKETGGIIYKKWELIELSPVSVAANSDAVITAIKKYDSALANVEKQTKTNLKKGVKMDKIEELKAKRDEIVALLNEFVDNIDELDDEEMKSFEDYKKEVETIDKRLEILSTAKLLSAEKSVPVENVNNFSRAKNFKVELKTQKTNEKLAFIKAMTCVINAKGDEDRALSLAKKHYPKSEVIQEIVAKHGEKALVPAGSTQAGNWLHDLTEAGKYALNEFVLETDKQRVLANSLVRPYRVEANTRFTIVHNSMNGHWVGEGKAKPLTKGSFDTDMISFKKLATITVATNEALRYGSDRTAEMLQRQLTQSLIRRENEDLLNPLNAGSLTTPASILYGAPNRASTGSTVEDFSADLTWLLEQFALTGDSMADCVFLVDRVTALRASSKMNALGTSKAFPDLTMNGGTLEGLPVVVVDELPRDSDGSIVALVNFANVALVDDGAFTVDSSNSASLEMSDSPTHDSTTPSPAELVSMFQTNSVAFRAEKYINWKVLKDKLAAAYVTGVSL